MGKSKTKYFRQLFSVRYFPVFLLLLAFLTYGILLPFLGFYWDDFPYAWFAHVGGANGVFRAVAEDRPVLGLLYAVTVPILGGNPLVWQFFAIITHWLCAFLVFLLIKEIWHSQEDAAWIAILFLVFPGFGQHWISVIYSQLFLLLALFFGSLLLMVHSLKDRKRYWLFTLLSILTSLFSMACSEYTVGLELIRPFIIYFILHSDRSGKRSKEIFISAFNRWLPYLASLFIFGIYRVFIASSVLYSVRITNDLLTNPFGLILGFFKSSFNNLINAGIIAWFKPFFVLTSLDLNHWIDRIYLIIIVAALICLYFLSKIIVKTNPVSEIESSKKRPVWLILIGLTAIVLSGIPFFAVKYELSLSFPYDRLVLPMMLGSCLFLLGISQLVFRNPVYQKLFLILVIAFSIGSHFMKANGFREDWENLRVFFWQLRWRVPDMQSETMLLTDELPMSYYSDNSLTAPLNWIYQKPIENNQLPFILNFLSVRLGNRIPNLEPNTYIDQYYRIFNFNGNTSNSLVMQFSPPGCLHILEPDLDRYNPNVSPELSLATGLTNFSRIINRQLIPSNGSSFPLGNEPAHNWCYYYELAALAQQFQDWEKIVSLGEKAFNLNDYPNDPIERFPFIEAYAHFGNYDRAFELSQKTFQISPLYSRILCALWDRIEKSTDIKPIPLEIKDFLSNQLSCE
jgi:hypothetical protein